MKQPEIRNIEYTYPDQELKVIIHCNPETAQKFMDAVKNLWSAMSGEWKDAEILHLMENKKMCFNYLGGSHCKRIARPFPCDGFDNKCPYFDKD